MQHASHLQLKLQRPRLLLGLLCLVAGCSARHPNSARAPGSARLAVASGRVAPRGTEPEVAAPGSTTCALRAAGAVDGIEVVPGMLVYPHQSSLFYLAPGEVIGTPYLREPALRVPLHGGPARLLESDD
ncbi:MAG TPA: hypothetical protein VNG33_02605, partial [Polyangiaceae bacterium]|nr:hypothetical protein [Polyangiaceae bacterium]